MTLEVKNINAVSRLVAVCWMWVAGVGLPVDTQGQTHRIGVLTPGLTFEPVSTGLREGLERFGYVDGKNISILVEDAKGDMSTLGSRIRRLIDSKPDVLFVAATAPTAALKQATQSIPIVFAGIVDPVQSGFVASLVSSANNLTGVSANLIYQSPKRLEVLKEFGPQIRKILAIVSTHDSVVATTLKQLKQLEDAAAKMKIKVSRYDAAGVEDLEKLFARDLAPEVDGIFHMPSVFVEKFIDRLIAKSLKERLPMSVHDEILVGKGALVSFGGDRKLYGVQAARLVAKILKGEKPSNIPTETPDQLLTVVNRSTAKLLGAKVSKEAMTTADRIVE